ncbi:hypothetical protein E2C01_019082 [Portunus trituberculatus]|uniref:Uncharacterized protein n=1 Tax=Portunus trituberculatus TaxID=210409 RepID=A0A5B7DY31_PORTR|nr:hypothetical protein [Portunus trituberculatus]
MEVVVTARNRGVMRRGVCLIVGRSWSAPNRTLWQRTYSCGASVGCVYRPLRGTTAVEVSKASTADGVGVRVGDSVPMGAIPAEDPPSPGTSVNCRVGTSITGRPKITQPGPLGAAGAGLVGKAEGQWWGLIASSLGLVKVREEEEGTGGDEGEARSDVLQMFRECEDVICVIMISNVRRWFRSKRLAGCHKRQR